MPRTYKTTEQLFWAKVIKSNDPDGCYVWTGSTSQGYGQFRVKGKTWKAHRWAWTQRHGEIPKGMNICHHCDNPGCVRDEHLYSGTHQDNVNDRQRRNRQASHKGQLNGRAKLTEDQVVLIKLRLKLNESQNSIAKAMNISHRQVWSIAHDEAWGHVN